MNKSNRFLFSFIGLIVSQIIMSLEEVVGRYPEYLTLFTEKLHDKIPAFPVIYISGPVFMFSSLILIIILFVFLGLVFIESKWSRIFAVTLGIFEIINGGFHIFASIYYFKYIPGSITAVIVIIFSLLIIIFKPVAQQTEPEETQ